MKSKETKSSHFSVHHLKLFFRTADSSCIDKNLYGLVKSISLRRALERVVILGGRGNSIVFIKGF